MSDLSLLDKINAFETLGKFLHQPDEELSELTRSLIHHNAWFSEDNVQRAVASFANMLNRKAIEQWLNKYPLHVGNPKVIGLVLAGNIPMVGLHDILCVLAAGHHALIKLSSSDNKLIPYILNKLANIEPAFANCFSYADRLKDFDAVIATGSNNTSRYFDHYFGKVPHIIRRNRNSVAVITGNETDEQIFDLGNDIFNYFGLGCRSVSKVYLPEVFPIEKFFVPIEPFKEIINQHKYNNNYDYNKSIYLVNGDEHFDNGFLLLKEDAALCSPLAVLYFERYTSLEELTKRLNEQASNIQCIVSGVVLQTTIPVVGYGESQHPKLWDYADNVDTMQFLTSQLG